jgi:hypothetical protein
MESTTLSDNSQRSSHLLLIMKIIIVLIGLSLFFSIFSIAQGSYYWAIDMPVLGLSMFTGYLITSILSSVLFLQWFRRAYHNLHKAGAKNLITTEGWAVGSWFVPILNLIRPYEIMREIWIGTQQMYTPNKFERSAIASSTGLVNGWWTTFLFSRVIGVLLSFVPNNYFSVFTNLISLLAAYYTYQMIKESSKHQTMLLNHKNALAFGKIEPDKNFE